ncbi:unnamed protein product [Pedinophyceae sp. YPF-701]|nr:unnamed protein product [Pedinophyceae sp. YPF-701]
MSVRLGADAVVVRARVLPDRTGGCCCGCGCEMAGHLGLRLPVAPCARTRGARRASGGNKHVLSGGPAFRRDRPSSRACARVRSSQAPSSAPRSDRAAGAEEYKAFCEAAKTANLVPLVERVMADQLTPVLAYRCLVGEDDVDHPSFLFESVVNGTQQGRYSFIGARPALEVLAHGSRVSILDHVHGTREERTVADPMRIPEEMQAAWRPARAESLPDVFTGGWVGFTGYETVRYVYPGKIPFDSAPEDDRGLPDLHLALYNDTVVFDQATKLAYCVSWVHVGDFDDVEAAYRDGRARLSALAQRMEGAPPTLQSARLSLSTTERSSWSETAESDMGKQGYLDGVAKTKEYIQSGDVFQLVLSHRFERRTFADPFEVYRALRVVNPSPYMVYLQARGCVLVASSPEILCRVDGRGVVTNRPLAGTRKRGRDDAEDVALEEDLLADEKERAEHIMLVDLGRNDVGKVSEAGSVTVERLMDVERYSHVMHISSTVTGALKRGLNSWDALRAALPAGTISGAPKVRAMQIIDELEVHRRGPYGGGVGHVSFTGEMDMALALRTMIVPTDTRDQMYAYGPPGTFGDCRREWVFHIQSGAGLVADSVPEAEHEETVNKAAALVRAIDVAEEAFVRR